MQFDTVVLNSVAQYFPDIAYLQQVLEGAARTVGKTGQLFIGDLRHLAHVEMFHASVQLGRASARTTMRQLKSRISRAVAQDKELVLAPALFHRLAAHLGMGRVEIQLKRGRSANELTRYRYDVVLHAQCAQTPQPELLDCASVHWLERLDCAASLLALPQSSCVVFRISRLARDVAAWRLIQQSDDGTTVAEVLAALNGMPVARR